MEDKENFGKETCVMIEQAGEKIIEGCAHVELITMVAWFLWISYILTLNELGKLEK